MIKATTKTEIPATPKKAINFNFSIFLTRVKGTSKNASTSTINHFET